MSEFKDENMEISGETDIHETTENIEESTVFSAPFEKNKKVMDPKRRRLLTVLSVVLAVAVLGFGIFASIKWIPKIEKDEENTSSIPEAISVLEIDRENIDNLVINNDNGTYKIYTENKQTTDSDGNKSTSVVWRLDGFEERLTSSGSISLLGSNAASIKAIREIDKKTADECGLTDSKFKVDVTLKSGEDFSIIIGDESPDNTGVYLKLSNSDKIYLVYDSVKDNFNFEPIDLANDSSFAPAEFSADISEYLNESGTLTKFDYIKLSGANFPKPVTVKPNSDGAVASVIAYVIAEPEKRYATGIETLLSAFTNGVPVSGAYSFDVSAESIKKVGLDNPDVVITMGIKGEEKTFTVKMVDKEFCAVINEDSYMIKKVSLPNISFAAFTAENLYSPWVCMDSIMDMETFTVTLGGETHVFDIIHNEVDEDSNGDAFTIKYNGNETDLANFQEFYMYFVGMKCANYSVDEVVAAPVMTIKLDMLGGSSKTITYTPFNDTKYQVTVDNQVLGKVSSTYYNKFVKYLNMVINGEKING